MQSTANTIKEYLDSLPEERKKAIAELRNIILKSLPKGFKEVMSYGMLGYAVLMSFHSSQSFQLSNVLRKIS